MKLSVRHRNRQVSLSILILMLLCNLTTLAQTTYGTIPSLPNFDEATPIAEIPKAEFSQHYTLIPEDQVWWGKKLENWDQFFTAGESVDVKFYYQKDANSKLIYENQLPITKSEPWYFKVQYIGLFYVVLEGDSCKVILKYRRFETGICQYQSYDCET